MASQRRVAVAMDIDKPFRHHTLTFAGIHDYAEQQENWHLIVDDWADRTLPASADAASPYDGMIGRITKLGADRARRLDVPVVNVWFNSPARGLPGVFIDYDECGRLMAEHLLARGFRNFGVLRHAADRATRIMGNAFEKAVRDADCDDFSKIVLAADEKAQSRISGQCDLSDYQQWKHAMRAIDQWMENWSVPIGLYIYDVANARVVIEKCAARGWRVPEDVAIVAGKNEETQCERPSPSMTSLEMPNQQIGYQAARLLDELMDEKEKRKRKRKGKKKGKRKKAVEPEPKTTLLLPVGIVGRQSTDFHAVDDNSVRRALGYMDANLHRPIHVEDIADYVEVSRRTLATRFRDHLGRSIASELQRLRIERVKRELTGTDDSIYKIAPRTGYASVRTLNDVFIKAVGCTPREYRKRAQATNRAGV